MSMQLNPEQEERVGKVFNAYGLAMMSAQLLERTLAVVVVVLGDEDIEPEGFKEVTETTFHLPLGRLVGALSLSEKVSSALADLLRSANDARIHLAHHFFVESLTRLFADPDELVAQLEEWSSEFDSLQKDVVRLAMPAVERRGVSAEHLDAFSQVTLLHLSENPGLGTGIDPFRDGEELVRRIAESLGLGGVSESQDQSR